MLDVNSFKNKFETGWWSKLEPFFITKKAEDIYTVLKEKAKLGAKILPTSDRTFAAFQECAYKDLKVVLCGMDPYPGMTSGVAHADGMAFSNSLTGKCQPSLNTLYAGIKEDLYSFMHIERCPDLSFLANQGVLLLNSSLTVEYNKVGSGKELWHPFHEYLFEMLNSYNPGMIYILLGKSAQELEKFIMPLGNYIMRAVHPSYANRNNIPWNHEHVFSRTNKILSRNNGEAIHWDREEILNQLIGQLPF